MTRKTFFKHCFGQSRTGLLSEGDMYVICLSPNSEIPYSVSMMEIAWKIPRTGMNKFPIFEKACSIMEDDSSSYFLWKSWKSSSTDATADSTTKAQQNGLQEDCILTFSMVESNIAPDTALRSPSGTCVWLPRLSKFMNAMCRAGLTCQVGTLYNETLPRSSSEKEPTSTPTWELKHRRIRKIRSRNLWDLHCTRLHPKLMRHCNQ